MFSALRLGSILYILEKGDHPTLKMGLVVSVSLPTYNNNFLATPININVKVGDLNTDFLNVNGALSVTSYNNVTIAETKELMSNEVENMLLNSKNIIESVPYHNGVIESCEEILKDLNPRFAKEKERDEDISNLKNKIGGLENKMDTLISILSKEKDK